MRIFGKKDIIYTQKSDSGDLDAFQRQRVSNPENLFSSTLQYGKGQYVWDELIEGDGSATHLPNESAVEMEIGTASGDRVIRQSREFIRYQPGKSQFIKITGGLEGSKENVEKLLGITDEDNGIYLGVDGNGPFVTLRSSTSGSVSEERLYQKDWNVDRLNGKTKSKTKLDLSKTQLFVIDLEWLSVGRVRVGFMIDGRIHYVHEFLNANRITVPYMTTANLPIRYEIKNTGATSSRSTMKQICADVESEGGQQKVLAFPFTEHTTNVNVPQGRSNKEIVFALQHKITFNGIKNRASFLPKSAYVTALGSEDVIGEVIYSPTITVSGGANWQSFRDDSIMDYATDIGSEFTGGIPIQTTISLGGGGNSVPLPDKDDIAQALPFGTGINANDPIPLGFAIYSPDGATTAHIKFEWEELR